MRAMTAVSDDSPVSPPAMAARSLAAAVRRASTVASAPNRASSARIAGRWRSSSIDGIVRKVGHRRNGMLSPPPAIKPMTADPPKYRPLERFWPYAELPEQPTAEELAALDPDLHEALFGAQTAAVLDHAGVSGARPSRRSPRALDLARASAEFRETGAGDGHPLSRPLLVERRRQAARSLSDRRGSDADRGADRRSAGAVRARALAAARVVPHSAVARCHLHHRTGSQRLEADLKQLEAEYNMFFAGRLPKPPWETRAASKRWSSNSTAATSRIPAIAFAFRRCSRDTPRSSICGIAACGRAKKDGPVRLRRSATPVEPERKAPEDRILHVAAFQRSGARD